MQKDLDRYYISHDRHHELAEQKEGAGTKGSINKKIKEAKEKEAQKKKD